MRAGGLVHGVRWRAAALFRRIGAVSFRLRDRYLRLAVCWNWWRRSRRPGRPHGLPVPLIISLTSFPARYDTLHLTLKSLMGQSVRPDRVILWLAEEATQPSGRSDGAHALARPQVGRSRKGERRNWEAG